MIINKAFAMRLSQLLVEKGMSKYALEKKSGVSHSALRHIFNERNKEVKISTVVRISKALGITLDEFFTDKLFNIKDLDLDA